MPELSYDISGNPIENAPVPSLTPQISSPTPEQVQGKINLLARKNGAPPDLATLIAKNESNFNPNAVNPARLKGGGHAQGVFQFTPDTAKRYGLDDPLNPDKNIDAGTKFIGDLNKLYNGDKRKIAIHYNAGPSHVNDKFEDLPEETQNYLTKLGLEKEPSKSEQVYDINGNPLDVSKSQFLPKALTPQQIQAGQQRNATYTPESTTIGKAAEYAPLALGAAGGYLGGLAGMPNVGAGVGSGLGEIIAGSAQHGVPTQEDLKNALEGGLSAFALGKAFSIPGALKSSVTKSIANKAAKSADILEQARQDITGGIESGSTEGEQDLLKAKLAPVKEAETAKWEKVNSRMDKASHIIDAVTGTDPSTGQPTTTPTPVRGPVKLSKDTLDYINSTKQQLEDVVQKFPTPKLVNAYRSLDRVSQAMVTDKNGDAYLPFDASKQLRTDIGALTAQESKLNLQAPTKSIGLQRGGGVLTGLRDKLGNDIESTLAEMGPDALKEYGDAVGMTKARIKANLFDKVISRNTNEGTGMLNIDKAINDFKSPTSPISKEFTSEERNSITQALQAVRNTSPQYDGALKYGAQGPGKFIFYSAYAAAHPLKFAVAISSKDMFEKVLSQPKYARILTQLPSAPSKSSQANILTKSLFKGALKSVPAEMIAPSGMRIKNAHIDENGEPKPDFQLSSQ